MPVQLFQVDSFTAEAFRGNPAAVCVLDRPAHAPWMQCLALENNLSETAFLVRRGDGEWDLRWFTPAVEVDLCGHATLASAHVLWESGLATARGTIRFHTLSGVLTASTAGEWIELDFPSRVAGAVVPPPDLLPALGCDADFVGFNGMDYLVEVASPGVVTELAPDFRSLRRLGVRGVMVTARAQAGDAHDFVSRFFAPGAGIDEDPVTGSAHCALGPHWAGRLGRSELVGYQASSRGGIVRVRVTGNRTVLGGRAITVFRADLAPAALPPV